MNLYISDILPVAANMAVGDQTEAERNAYLVVFIEAAVRRSFFPDQITDYAWNRCL